MYDRTGSSSRPLQLGLLALSPPTSQDHSCTTLCPEQLSYAICRLTGFLSSLILLPFEGDALRRILIVLVLVGATVPLSRNAGASSVTVAAAGDIARPSFGTPQQQTADLVTTFDPMVVFALGDEQYENGELANFQKYYDVSWGAFKSKTYPIPGNHEYQTSGATGYFSYFGAAAGDPSKGYYSFDLGDWHVVALNTNCGVIDCTAQKSWMVADLAADTHLCQVVVYHATNRKWPRQNMEAAGGDLALAASRHVYERWAPENGLVRLTVGTGGRSLGKLDPAAAVGVREYGILRLTLDASSYTWSFIDVNETVRDSGSGACHD